MLGIYARTDIERGVHKAPANEVVRGIIGLRRKVNKEQQDILNPYPVNINVIRDFRDNNRGIRVWGGRVITSDPDWKYVNVRRLLIFIEASIDRGLQWVVFEPNAEPLWARVRRDDQQLPDGRVAQRRARGHQAGGGVLRQVRPHDDDADRHRQRPADRADRRRAGEAGRVRDRPHRPVDRPLRQLTHRRLPMTDARLDPFRTFNFRLEIDGTEVAAFSEVSGLTSTAKPSYYRDGTDIPLTVRKLIGLRKFGPITLKRGMVARRPRSGTGTATSSTATPTGATAA